MVKMYSNYEFWNTTKVHEDRIELEKQGYKFVRNEVYSRNFIKVIYTK